MIQNRSTHTHNEHTKFQPRVDAKRIWWRWWYVSIFNLTALYRGCFQTFLCILDFIITYENMRYTTHFSFIYFVFIRRLFKDVCAYVLLFLSSIASNFKWKTYFFLEHFFFWKIRRFWAYTRSGTTCTWCTDRERKRMRAKVRKKCS